MLWFAGGRGASEWPNEHRGEGASAPADVTTPEGFWFLLHKYASSQAESDRCFLPHQAVLSVHDTVAQKNFDPVLPPLPDDFEDELEEESVKIVRLVKNKEPLVSCGNENLRTESKRFAFYCGFFSFFFLCLCFREPPSDVMKPQGP